MARPALFKVINDAVVLFAAVQSSEAPPQTVGNKAAVQADLRY
jgi:hypothetical protein